MHTQRERQEMNDTMNISRRQGHLLSRTRSLWVWFSVACLLALVLIGWRSRSGLTAGANGGQGSRSQASPHAGNPKLVSLVPLSLHGTQVQNRPADCSPFDVGCLLQEAASWATAQTFDQINPLVKWINSNPLQILTRTNEGDTYLQKTVVQFWWRSYEIVGEALGVLVMVAGYNVMRSGRFVQEAIAALPEIGIVFILVSFSGIFFQAFIDISNDLCASFGKLATIDGLLNLFTTFFTFKVFTAGLVTFGLAGALSLTEILLAVEMLARIMVIDVLLALGPFGIACFALPQLRPFGILYLKGFFVVVFIQPAQVALLGLAGVLMSTISTISIPELPQNVMQLLLGVTACFLALRLPFAIGGWTLRPALEASTSSIQFIEQTARTVGQTVVRAMSLP